MTSITWASPRYVQELTTILAPQNRTQGSCDYSTVQGGGHLGRVLRDVQLWVPCLIYVGPGACLDLKNLLKHYAIGRC